MIEVDTHEPTLAFSYIGQAVEAKLVPLNDAGWADYKWLDLLGQPVQAERKTWKDLTGDLDSIEYQIRQEVKAHKEARTILLIEGVADPGPLGTVLYHPTKGTKRNVFYASNETAARYSKVMAWLYQVEKFIEVYHTATLKGTCSALVAFYYGDQKEGHDTFKRYLRVMDWNPNPQVESLMGIGRGIGIGPTKAEALIKRFGTLWNVLNADPNQLQAVAGIGKVNALRLLRKAGRTDV